MARRLGDSEILVGALHARHWALATPEKVQERLAHTEEMLPAAEQAANREMQFLAHNARFHCFLELCDRRAVDQEVEAMAQAADFIRQPFFTWHVLCLRTVRAILDGHLDEAERLAAEALALAELRHGEYPAYVFHYAQMFAIRWAQGRLAEVWDAGDSHGDRFPWIPRWRDALGAAELSDTETARAELDRHSARDFADLPRDGLWILHVCALAEACGVRGRPRARREALRAAGAVRAAQRRLLHPAAVRPRRAAAGHARGAARAPRRCGAPLRGRAAPVRPARRARAAGPGLARARAQPRRRDAGRRVPPRGRRLDARLRGGELPAQGRQGPALPGDAPGLAGPRDPRAGAGPGRRARARRRRARRPRHAGQGRPTASGCAISPRSSSRRARGATPSVPPRSSRRSTRSRTSSRAPPGWAAATGACRRPASALG